MVQTLKATRPQSRMGDPPSPGVRRVGRKRKPQPKEVRRTIAGKFGARLEQLVNERGMTVNEFADAIGKSRESVRAYFKGRASPPLYDWPLICQTLGVKNPRDLLPE